MTQASPHVDRSMPATPRPRILTGDTPTGQLHLGHFVGSVKQRVALQDSHECYFIIANMHAFTTRSGQPQEIHDDCLEIVRDYLAMGIDPHKSAIFLQTEVPAISELTYLFAMLLPFNRVMRNPTRKEEIRVKDLGDNYSFGFPLYAVGQTADILAFRAHAVPVGEDQVPHIELTREVARRFNQMYCGISDQADDADHEKLGAVFPIPLAQVGSVGRLVGTDGRNKMSKSLSNAIYISDTHKSIRKKLGKLYTGRQNPTDPGDTGNALFQYVRTFIPDPKRVAELERAYAEGDNIGDGHIKVEVADAINELLEPMRQRRAEYEGNDEPILEILKDGCARANARAEETLAMAKEAAKLSFFERRLEYTEESD
jgi:tryptophanyl-tRNA synthetase